MTRALRTLGLLFVVAGVACSTDQFTDVDNNKSDFFYIRLTPEAASIAVGQTQQVTVTAFDAGPCNGSPCSPFAPGNALAVTGTPTFRSTDTTKVKVSATGLVTGIAAGSASIIGTLQDIPGFTNSTSVTRADTTIFTVTATPVALGSVQLAGRATGTANTVAAGSTLALTTTISNSAGTAITNVGRAQYYSSNPAIATVSTTGTVSGLEKGNATILATITVGGVTKTASYDIVVTSAISGTVSIANATSGTGVLFFPATLTVSATEAKVEGKAGATVAFAVTSGTFTASSTPNNTQCFNVTFANPSAAAAVPPSTNAGNIGVGAASSADPPLCSGTQSRLFSTPGTYTFTSSTNGATGTVIVE